MLADRCFYERAEQAATVGGGVGGGMGGWGGGELVRETHAPERSPSSQAASSTPKAASADLAPWA